MRNKIWSSLKLNTTNNQKFNQEAFGLIKNPWAAICAAFFIQALSIGFDHWRAKGCRIGVTVVLGEMDVTRVATLTLGTAFQGQSHWDAPQETKTTTPRGGSRSPTHPVDDVQYARSDDGVTRLGIEIGRMETTDWVVNRCVAYRKYPEFYYHS